ncbi:MAG: drug/metabolite exporter YedA [Ignavibacteriales bacterium]|nr:drug/metabolite exporter YedA [Ignavibacteriales bacterium]
MSSSPSRLKIASAFAAIYIIWGSTYLGIRFAVETIPPFLMAGGRFLVSGVLLYAWVQSRTPARPTLNQWKSAAIVGGLLLLGGNGVVAWAEQWVPSGITALIIASSPIFFVLIDALQRKTSPTMDVVSGLVFGTVGIFLLIDPTRLIAGDEIYIPGAIAILLADVAWAYGSLYSRKADLPSNPLLATAMEMLAGGVLLTLTGLLLGETGRLDISAISAQSLFAVLYLIVFGSLIAFTSYVWLLRVASPAMVSTYAYVNPVIAVLLGWLIGNEAMNNRIVVAAMIIVGAVVIITTFNARRTARSLKNLKVETASQEK